MKDQEKLREHAQEETKGRKCPICGNQEWEIAEDVYILKGISGDDNAVACAKCTNCGFVALFAEE